MRGSKPGPMIESESTLPEDLPIRHSLPQSLDYSAPGPAPLPGSLQRIPADTQEVYDPDTARWVPLPWELAARLELAASEAASAHSILVELSPESARAGRAAAALEAALAGAVPANRAAIRLAWWQSAAENASAARQRLIRALGAVEEWYAAGEAPRI